MTTRQTGWNSDDSPRLKAGGFSVHGGGVFSCRSPKAPAEPEKSCVSRPTPGAGCSVVGALGIDAEGHKRVLGLVEGATENHTVVTALLQDLSTRGLTAAPG